MRSKIILLLGLVLSSISIGFSQTAPSAYQATYTQSVHEMLRGPLWQARDAYDSTHFLMVPMWFSYQLGFSNGIQDFNKFFNRFIDENGIKTIEGQDKLTQLQFSYFVSWFLILNQGHPGFKYQENLQNWIQSKFETAWSEPAWQWSSCGISNFSAGQYERITWKLSNLKPKLSYCRVIIDEELFLIGIAANLRSLNYTSKNVDLAVQIAKKVFEQEVVWESNRKRWIFQPNVWRDHPDYAYSGYVQKEPGLAKNSYANLANDSSHSTRMPLILRSLELSHRNQLDSKFYQQLIAGLSNQFHEFVVVAPDGQFHGYRTKNFMNGWNGLYRYAYSTNAANLGYGPFELSGSMLLGWWVFLGDGRSTELYCNIYKQFPLSQDQIKVYLGPDTTRDRHPLIKGTSQFTSGLLETVAAMACKLSERAFR